MGLRITIEGNLDKVNFLDISLDLTLDEYRPYMKPNSNPRYIDVRSNHPEYVIKSVPAGVNKRLNILTMTLIWKKYQRKIRKKSNLNDNIYVAKIET